MPRADFEHLLTFLSRAIDAIPGTRRDLEDAMGVGHGTLPRLLDGRLELKVRHLLALAQLLDVPPGDFFTLGCPKAGAKARYSLADRLTPRSPTRGESAVSALGTGAVEQLVPLLRQLIQEELAGSGPPAAKKRGNGAG